MKDFIFSVLGWAVTPCVMYFTYFNPVEFVVNLSPVYFTFIVLVQIVLGVIFVVASNIPQGIPKAAEKYKPKTFIWKLRYVVFALMYFIPAAYANQWTTGFLIVGHLLVWFGDAMFSSTIEEYLKKPQKP